MKKIETINISNKFTDLNEIKHIIKNLFTEESEEWLVLTNSNEKILDYIQVHYDIEILDNINPVKKYISSVLNYDSEMLYEKDFYLIEYRKYDNESEFKHYRAFFDKAEIIISYLENYFKDEQIDVSQWIDVTDEFK